jgi:hypothetical protein
MANSLIDFLQFNIATSKEIQNNTGSSQASVAREIQKLDHRIIKIANGRSPKYALTKNAFGMDDKIGLWQVDSHGGLSHIALIRPLAVGGFFVEESVGMPKVFLGEKGNGLYDDLPYFLRDMAPQGFLGKKIAKEMSKNDEAFSNNPDMWSKEQIGRYLLSNNDNAMGNLKFGINTNLRLQQKFSRTTAEDYLRLAQETISEEIPESSAGGEQPKFTTFCTEKNAHVIVKFSALDNNEITRRWRDVLITEYYANKVLNQSDITASNSRLIEKGDRLFLESIRFDRQYEQGRSSMLSLKMIDAEFVGLGENWVKVLTRLKEQKLINEQDLFNGKILWLFGRLINNTDMHLGNISFSAQENTFHLLPIYDMCSMGFAPKSNGEVLPYSFETPEIPNIELRDEDIKSIKEMVKSFWQLVAKDERISLEFKTFVDQHLNQGQTNLF